MDLFAYGTLMCPELLRALTGLRRAPFPARLEGYRRRCMVRTSYPGIAPCAGEGVEGVLYRALPRTALGILDAFEGAEYRRRILTVDLDGAGVSPALCYVLRPHALRCMRAEPWSLAHFRERSLAALLPRASRIRTSVRLGRGCARLA
ncbi:MAG: gamma-glutamylcyclotransferase family protein [Pseudomonadales bacterium]|jgi:gamma-glutamylcyclotransferase (GGCT)/AIG2-like uncharacterized protein YtfP|nr:gamma-glutamylcyclotransferase family protein [Pseudomonadales bacterium]